MSESSLYNKQLIQEENFLTSFLFGSDQPDVLYGGSVHGLPNAIIDGMGGLEEATDTFVFNVFPLSNGSALRINLKTGFPVGWGGTFYPLQTGDLATSGVVIDNAIFKYGASSYQFDGISAYMGSSGGGLQLETNNFTFGVWVYLPTAPGTYTIISGGQGDATNFAFKWEITSSGMDFIYSTDGSTPIALSSDVLSWSTATWYYLTVERDGSDLNFYRDGIMVGTSVISGSLFYAFNLQYIYIGRNPDGTTYFEGNMDDITLRYKAYYGGVNFTPPTGELNSPEYADIDVHSNTYSIPSDITRLRFLVFSAVLTNDVIFEISLDNGTTYTPVTLNFRNICNYYGASNIYSGSIDTSTLPSTNQMKYRISSQNEYYLTINYIILAWDSEISGDEGITEPSSGGGVSQNDLVIGDDILPRENPTVGDVLAGIYNYFRKNNRRQL